MDLDQSDVERDAANMRDEQYTKVRSDEDLRECLLAQDVAPHLIDDFLKTNTQRSEAGFWTWFSMVASVHFTQGDRQMVLAGLRSYRSLLHIMLSLPKSLSGTKYYPGNVQHDAEHCTSLINRLEGCPHTEGFNFCTLDRHPHSTAHKMSS